MNSLFPFSKAELLLDLSASNSMGCKLKNVCTNDRDINVPTASERKKIPYKNGFLAAFQLNRVNKISANGMINTAIAHQILVRKATTTNQILRQKIEERAKISISNAPNFPEYAPRNITIKSFIILF